MALVQYFDLDTICEWIECLYERNIRMIFCHEAPPTSRNAPFWHQKRPSMINGICHATRRCHAAERALHGDRGVHAWQQTLRHIDISLSQLMKHDRAYPAPRWTYLKQYSSLLGSPGGSEGKRDGILKEFWEQRRQEAQRNGSLNLNLSWVTFLFLLIASVPPSCDMLLKWMSKCIQSDIFTYIRISMLSYTDT